MSIFVLILNSQGLVNADLEAFQGNSTLMYSKGVFCKVKGFCIFLHNIPGRQQLRSENICVSAQVQNPVSGKP